VTDEKEMADNNRKTAYAKEFSQADGENGRKRGNVVAGHSKDYEKAT
jgi:hypothetical protein